jgi:hypothetical protein
MIAAVSYAFFATLALLPFLFYFVYVNTMCGIERWCRVRLL